MPANDVLLLTEKVEESRSQTSGLGTSEQDAYFFAKHFLKVHSPSHDDILSGIVDGEHDGGLDTMHIFVNGLCIRDDAPVRGMGYGADVQLICSQVKNVTGFSESAIEKLILHLPELLAIGRDEKKLAQRFNPKVLEVSRRFLRIVQELEMPELTIGVAFASFRAEQHPHPNVVEKGERLEQAIRSSFGTCTPYVAFLDAAGISEYARFREPTTKVVQLAENPISTDTSGGYIGVVALSDYYRFISDDNGRLDIGMFDSNVRDYESDSTINQSIQATLQEPAPEVDFWWLNNGVTVVADKIQLTGKRMTLSSPQIVNGLQTSYEVYRFGSRGEFAGHRSILVKLVEADKEEVKDRIIRATNSQTTLGRSSLRATDAVQRNIESYFRTIGLHYERRKNFYRNRQIPLDQLVSIDQLGQAVTATLAQFPHISRGEATRIFDDEVYPLVFHESFPLEVYGQAMTIVRSCENHLRQDKRTRGEVENFTFHLATMATIAMTRKRAPSATDLAKLDQVPGSSP